MKKLAIFVIAATALGVFAANKHTLRITTTSCPVLTLGQPYQCQIRATGGKPPYHWSIVAGSLPAGLALDPNTGLISGTVSANAVAPYRQGQFVITMAENRIVVPFEAR